MTSVPFTSGEYEQLVYSLPSDFPAIRYSTLTLIRLEPPTAIVRGEVYFEHDLFLRALQVLDFEEGVIQRYSYEVYRGEEKLYWYDSWPHPHIPELASTAPHHKHIPPDIKHNRIPAPELSFERPNLPFIIKEIVDNLLR
ncbi:MAG TPA: DUF6516 family protein [Anaerolineae bacterium]